MSPQEIIIDFEKVFPKGITSFVAPLNQKEEKEKFLKTGKEPKFIFDKIDKEKIKGARKSINQTFQCSSEALQGIYQKKIQDLSDMLNLLEVIGQSEITQYSDNLFLTHDLDILKIIDIRELDEKEKKVVATSKQISERIQSEFQKHNLQDWKIKFEDHMLSRGAVRGSQKTVLLKKDATFKDADDVEGFVAHEIYGHVFRYQNGLMQDDIIFYKGLAGSVTTEEGIASWNRLQVVSSERRKNLQDTMQLRAYAAMIAKKHSFSETFDAIYECTKDNNRAWAITMRVKRGVANGKDIGSFTKDAIYFVGLKMVEEFIKTNNLRELFVGRVGINDLDMVKQIPGIKPAQWFIEDLQS